MLETLKKQSTVTKILYLLAILIFLGWVIPTMLTYYSNVNRYEKNQKSIEKLFQEYGLKSETKLFNKELFKEETEQLFKKVNVSELDSNRYKIEINLKKENLKSFHNFIDTLSLRYFVQIEGDLNFKAKDETITVSFIIEKL